jgi:hypothetical protein
MAQRAAATLILSAVLACSGTPSTEGASPSASPTQATPAASGEPATGNPVGEGAGSALPDLTQELTRGACEDGPGNEGADSHFTGTFRWSGDTVAGEERWILGANEKWKKRGGNDCSISWGLTGSKVERGACSACDFGLMLTATPDIEGSDCPEGLVKADARRQELRYDVKLQDDGVAFLYFAGSGKRLGQGYHSGNQMVWLSQHQCKWF